MYIRNEFFTMVLKPDRNGQFPVVVTRSAYVSALKDKSEEKLAVIFMKENEVFLDRSFLVLPIKIRFFWPDLTRTIFKIRGI